MTKIRGLSLFANIGIAEAYFKQIGVDIVVANELIPERANLYEQIYPKTKMICGDITEKAVFENVINESRKLGVNFIMATPPCQGMSTAGKQNPLDPRNHLITYALDAIKELKPKFILLENVPQQKNTKITINGKFLFISDYILKELDDLYVIKSEVVNALNYGVPQMRQRLIFLMVRRDLDLEWNFLSPENYTKPITLAESIGNLPSLDPRIQEFNHEKQLKFFPEYDVKMNYARQISKWHYPPVHKLRHVLVMQHTPEGCSALQNDVFYPKNADGSKVRGYSNTYKRQSWQKPGYTVTTYNGAICSQDNVHPGRYIGKDCNGFDLYSDARVLSIFELMIVMSIPSDWPIPEGVSDSLLRHAIGEGIPPKITKKLLQNLIGVLSDEE